MCPKMSRAESRDESIINETVFFFVLLSGFSLNRDVSVGRRFRCSAESLRIILLELLVEAVVGDV